MAANWKKEPVWKEEWDRLIGDAKGLEIKNWRKYQPEQQDGISNSWFKSYTTTDEDEAQDIGTVRWLKDALRRARARRGGPLPADMHVLRMNTVCHPYDAKNFPRLVVELVSCGFLIPSNEQFSPKGRIEKGRGKEEESPSAPPAHPKTNTAENPSCPPASKADGCDKCFGNPDPRVDNKKGFDNITGYDCTCWHYYTDKTMKHEITREEWEARRHKFYGTS